MPLMQAIRGGSRVGLVWEGRQRFGRDGSLADWSQINLRKGNKGHVCFLLAMAPSSEDVAASLHRWLYHFKSWRGVGPSLAVLQSLRSAKDPG